MVAQNDSTNETDERRIWKPTEAAYGQIKAAFTWEVEWKLQRNFMSVSTDISANVYMKWDKMSALTFTAARYW